MQIARDLEILDQEDQRRSSRISREVGSVELWSRMIQETGTIIFRTTFAKIGDKVQIYMRT